MFNWSFAAFTWSQAFIGLGIFVTGVCLVRFSYQILRFTGEQTWIEQYTGSGSTNGIYKIFGVALVLLGLLVATGFGTDVLSFLLAPIKGVFQPIATGN
jgi:hypothetical protein